MPILLSLKPFIAEAEDSLGPDRDIYVKDAKARIHKKLFLYISFTRKLKIRCAIWNLVIDPLTINERNVAIQQGST